MFFVLKPATEVGEVVAPWHGHHAQHSIFQPPGETLSYLFTILGDSGDCWEGCLVSIVSQKLSQGAFKLMPSVPAWQFMC